MPLKLKTLVRTVLSFAFALVFLYLAFRGTNLIDLWASLKSVEYGWVLLLVPVTVLSHWLRAVRWSYLLSPVKENLSKRNLFSAVMIGYAVNNILPRLGELVRPYVIGRLENVSKSSAFGTVVVERIIDFVTFYFIVCVVLFMYPSAINPFVGNVQTVRPLLLLASFGALGLFIFLFFKAESVFKFTAKLKLVVHERHHERIDRMLGSFLSGFGVVKMKEKFGMIVLLSLLIWGLYALGLYIPFFAFETLARLHLDFGAAVVLLVVSSIAWVLPAPGAMGTYHSFLTVALVKLYGADNTSALSFSIITHELGYIIVMVLGFYYYVKDHLKVSEVTLDSADGQEA